MPHVNFSNRHTPLFRVTFRDGGRFRKITLANLNYWGAVRLMALENALSWWRRIPNINTANDVMSCFDDFDFYKKPALMALLLQFLAPRVESSRRRNLSG